MIVRLGADKRLYLSLQRGSSALGVIGCLFDYQLELLVLVYGCALTLTAGLWLQRILDQRLEGFARALQEMESFQIDLGEILGETTEETVTLWASEATYLPTPLCQ